MENIVLSATGIKPRTRRISLGTPPPQTSKRKPSLQQIEENETPSFQRPRRRAALSMTDKGDEDESSPLGRPRRRTLLNMNEVAGEEESVAFVHPRRRAALNISERSGEEGGEQSRAEMYEKMMANDVFEDENQTPNEQQDSQQLLLDNEQQLQPTQQQKQQQQQQKDSKGPLHSIHNIQEGTYYHAYVSFVSENTTLVELLLLLPLFLMVMYIVFVEQGSLFHVVTENADK